MKENNFYERLFEQKKPVEIIEFTERLRESLKETNRHHAFGGVSEDPKLHERNNKTQTVLPESRRIQTQ